MIVHVSLGEIVGFGIALVVLGVYVVVRWRAAREFERRRRAPR